VGELLRRELKPGEMASVVGEPHNGHVDGTLYQKGSDGQIYQHWCGPRAHAEVSIEEGERMSTGVV